MQQAKSIDAVVTVDDGRSTKYNWTFDVVNNWLNELLYRW